jgi:hypothetical protein
MNYTKPQIVLLGDAICVTQHQVKSTDSLMDFGGPEGTTGYNDIPAYEADE